MSDMQEYIVTLHNKEDLDDFYNDMETPGGNLYIPDRAVDLQLRRTISRNTHYMLTPEEAIQITNDPRVMSVEPRALADIITRSGYKIEDATFSKYTIENASHTNWGLLRHLEENNRTGWGSDNIGEIVDSITITASGKNVDVVIVDGHMDPAHPEFAVNPDGTGGSRVNQFNWFSLTDAIGAGDNGTYTYTPYVDGSDAEYTADNDHGCHVAGTVAGNTQGWARDANIYNINPYATNPAGNVSSLLWDYIRQWHNTKPINPETGRRNPTITNHSYGSTIRWNDGDFGPIERVTYRSVLFNPGRSLTVAEMNDRGIYTNDTTPSIPYYSTSRFADIQDAIDDGIIVVASAGNDSWKTVTSSDQDYNNNYYAEYLGVLYFWSGLHRGSSPGAAVNAINVGALSRLQDERKADFSNCGDKVDVYAAGQAIISSVQSTVFGFTQLDPRDNNYRLVKIQGTSMASPQVCGMVACLAETDPNITNAEAKQWIIDNATIGQMADSGADDATDVTSLQGSANRILRWYNQRLTSGNTFPLRTFKPRPSTGRLYPRTKIRRRG